jgi:hypothetical protein
VKDAPPYDPSVPLNRDDEMNLHKHHNRIGYWMEELNLENPQYRVVAAGSPVTGPAQVCSPRV